DDVVHQDDATGHVVRWGPDPTEARASSHGEGTGSVFAACRAGKPRLLFGFALAFEDEGSEVRTRVLGQRSRQERGLVEAALDEACAMKRYRNPGLLPNE